MSTAIQATSLTKSYGKARGIADITLSIEAGEVIGLVGANGAGKTTFMRVLLDVIRPTSGTLRVFGLDSVRDSVDVRRRSTYLPGELVMPARLTGHEVFRRFTFARAGVDPTVVGQLADRLDLDLSRPVGDLSKGNKQKLGLLLAFAPPAELLVLDEPTSGLDPLLQREFATMVAERAAEGATVLLSSHVMSEVEDIAQRVALLRAGSLVSVESIAAIRVRSRRRGQIRPRDVDDLLRIADVLQRVAGVSDVIVDHNTVGFACTGDMDALIKAVARFAVTSFDVSHTELEDAFLSAYADPAPGEASS